MPEAPTLAEALADDASGDWGIEAAVWLLTEHQRWLPELTRAGLIVRQSPNSETWVRIDWAQAAAQCQAQTARTGDPSQVTMIGTPSEWQILAAACSLTGLHALSWADLPALDAVNKRRVLHAVAWAAGGRDYAESLRLLAPDPADGPYAACGVCGALAVGGRIVEHRPESPCTTDYRLM